MINHKVKRCITIVSLVGLLMLANTLNLACFGKGTCVINPTNLAYIPPPEPRMPDEPPKQRELYGMDAIIAWLTYNEPLASDGSGY